MKTNYKILLCIALLIPSISYADWNWALWPWTANGPDLVTTGDVQSRSDRQRVGGSALILKSDGAIDEPSIPANAINKPSETGPDNKIFDGKVKLNQ